jgi:hypothetical protein
MMIRIIATSRSIEIDDPENFKAFSVRIEGRSCVCSSTDQTKS